MSRNIKTPANQKRFNNVAVVWLEVAGKRYEVAVYKNKIVQWRFEMEKDPRAVFQVIQVFRSVKTGEVPSQKELAEAFGTADVEKAATQILNKGKYQMNALERQTEEKQALGHLANYISEITIDTTCHKKWDPNMLLRGLEDYGFSFRLDKNMKVQALQAVRLLQQKTVPIARTPRVMLLRLPESLPAAAKATAMQRVEQLLTVCGCTDFGGDPHNRSVLCAPDRQLHLEVQAKSEGWRPLMVEKDYCLQNRNSWEVTLPKLPHEVLPPAWRPALHWCMPRVLTFMTHLTLFCIKRRWGVSLEKSSVLAVLPYLDYWGWPGEMYIQDVFTVEHPGKAQKKASKKEKAAAAAEEEEELAPRKGKRGNAKGKGGKGRRQDIDSDDEDDAPHAPPQNPHPNKESARGGGGRAARKGRAGKGEDIDEDLLAIHSALEQGKKAKAVLDEDEKGTEGGKKAPGGGKKTGRKGRKEKTKSELFGDWFEKPVESEDEQETWGFFKAPIDAAGGAPKIVAPAPEEEDIAQEDIMAAAAAAAAAEDDPEARPVVPVDTGEAGMARYRVLPNGKKVAVVGNATINTTGVGPSFLY